MEHSVVITGAGRGLGFALAKRHLIMGDEVHALEIDLSDELLILQKYNERLAVYSCDVCSSDSVRTAASELLSAKRQIHRIYNCAGLRLRDVDGESLLQTDLDGGLRLFDTNALGLLRICKALWPLIEENSLIVNVTDEEGSITACHQNRDYLYKMSKAAANMASKILSNELFAKGVRVLCYHPGVMRTALGGTEAIHNPESMSPEVSAAALIELLEKPRPADQLFIGNKGRLYPW